MKKQNGMVLFASLIILIIMTVIGVALATNSNMSMKMAGAGSERIEASIIANGALDKVIDDNEGASFANMTVETTANVMGESQSMQPLLINGTVQDVECLRSPKANGSTTGISCRRIEISSSASFGKNDIGNLTVILGVEQEVM
ncbi:pilus assembly PilX N-terminal domain-containing protein [Shewanella sp. KX20019]|uniref:pilus assembly PilX family protein n=1 Tax=Shewanella sp. KX20019 TaxID=2803864 RepID=UPI001928F1CE|nr:pilus assembly PilX N-terminal domain-containing protein [Shewanella sp. KX20019]QQX81507.1 pilus assembly PilX N-terminal domain-containing protein [Shewanella sp. KX20019]